MPAGLLEESGMTLLCCPACGGEMSLDVLIAHNELRQATFTLVEKSLSLGSLAMRYVALFRPAKNRMSADRWAKLILQLQPDLQRNAITHKGRDWHMPLEGWKAGFEAMLEKAAAGKLTLPLENHNYLYTVLVGMADKVEAVVEEDTEQTRRVQRPVQAPAGLVPALDVLTCHLGMPAHIKAQADAIRRGESITGARHD
jgi:hypothetical protein